MPGLHNSWSGCMSSSHSTRVQDCWGCSVQQFGQHPCLPHWEQSAEYAQLLIEFPAVDADEFLLRGKIQTYWLVIDWLKRCRQNVLPQHKEYGTVSSTKSTETVRERDDSYCLDAKQVAGMLCLQNTAGLLIRCRTPFPLS